MSNRAHPLYGKPLVVNISDVINNYKGDELTISQICCQLIIRFPGENKKTLARRVRSCINSMAQSQLIKTRIAKTPDHKLPYLIIEK